MTSPRRPDDLHDDELEELAAGYALQALDADDEARFRAHLAGCLRCRTLVADYATVAAALPEVLEEIEASPTVRQRVLGMAEQDAGAARAEPVPLRQGQGHRRPDAAASPPARPGLPARWAVPLAALFAVTFGFGAWTYRLQQQLTEQAAVVEAQRRDLAERTAALETQRAELADQTAVVETQRQALAAVAGGGRQWTVAGTDAAPEAGGVLVQGHDDPRPFLLVRDLPELPPQQAYQAWVIVNGTPVEAGLFDSPKAGPAIARLERPLGGANTVAVSVEPAGGSRSPTGPIVMAGTLQT